MMTLDNLSTEILLKVFSYLNIVDLCHLKQTCKRFDEILNNWGHLFINVNECVATSQQGSDIKNRSSRMLTPFEKLRISRNWKQGCYREVNLLYDRHKYMPWIVLQSRFIWASRGSTIRAYKRNKKGFNTRNVHKIESNIKGEVRRFTIKNNLLLSGLTEGGLWMWSLDENRFLFELENCHQSDINDIDFCDNYVVTGCRDGAVKVWKRCTTSGYISPGIEFRFSDRIWCLSLNPQNNSLIAIGRGARPQNIIVQDIESESLIGKFGYPGDYGTLHLKWENPQLLWTSGYGAFLCRWDLRLGCLVQKFLDPLRSPIYCFDCDFNNTVLCGTQTNGRAVLYDTRLKHYVNMYFMECCRSKYKSSPIYSLSFDPSYLFTATDEHINVLDFSAFGTRERDYTNFRFTSDVDLQSD